MYPEMFERCIRIVLRNEGGYGNHPADPGGETMYGIADASDGKKDGMIDLDRDGIPDVKVKDLTVDQAKQIYYDYYWKPMHLDGLTNEDLVLQVFDFGVNAGPRRSIKMLQYLVEVEMDGICGSKTSRYANHYQGNISKDFRAQRKHFYLDLVKKNPEKLVFIGGWLSRAENTQF